MGTERVKAMKSRKKGPWKAGTFALACVMIFGIFPPGQVFADTGAKEKAADGTGSQILTVEYENLRELLKAGNFNLKQTKERQENNSAPYEEMREVLKEEQEYMEDMAKAYEEDGDVQMQEFYENHANQLKAAAGQVSSQLRRLNSYSQEKSYEKQVDACLLTAQALMNTYNQMALKVKVQEKQAEALLASFQEIKSRYEAGLVKSEAVSQAANALTASENSLASLKENAAKLRSSLLSMLGLSDSPEITIGAIPEPDLAAIEAIDLESDKQTAVSNDSTYVSELNSRVKGTDARTLKSRRIEDAAAEEMISLTSAYQELLNQKAQYEAALQSFQAAELDHQALLRKKQAGLLKSAEYLEGEAQYVSKQADKETAAMELKQAYETYCWEVKGRI